MKLSWERQTIDSEPFAHMILENLVDNGTFNELSDSWPGGYLSSVPSESTKIEPRRKHLWLDQNIPTDPGFEIWRELRAISRLETTKQALVEIASTLNVSVPGDVRCWIRLCEEALPYSLARHRDQANKILSVVWFISPQYSEHLGTQLFSDHGSDKIIPFNGNTAVCIPNSKSSFHGGNWSSSKHLYRRTIQIFLVR